MCSASRMYPGDWSEIAREVKERAAWRCETCGREHDPEAGYTLTVHHLDGDPGNCAPDNLMALCQRCHMVWCGRQRKYGPEDGRQMRLGAGKEGVGVFYGSEVVKGLVTGLIIGLTITLVVGLVGVVLAHFCVWPIAPWCAWW